jgi:hypothetical protein
MTPIRGDMVRLRSDHTRVGAVLRATARWATVRWFGGAERAVGLSRIEVVGRWSGAQ